MAGKKKSKRRIRGRSKGWWASLDGRQKKRALFGAAVFLGISGVTVLGLIGVDRLEAHVNRLRLARAQGVARFVDLPARLAELAEHELRDSLSHLIDRPWTNDRLCRALAERLGESGWVAEVKSVRRLPDASFDISCRYRQPVAMVQQEGEFYLVDRAAVRLPGVYRYEPSWLIVQGVAQPAPAPGRVWEGDDLRAALVLIGIAEREPFARQITAVLVGNFGGRMDALRTHLELATDRAGGRIRWGSAPGSEFEENSIEQKLAILRHNFRQTGRADANHPVIDVSTFPDRFTIPG
jgi:hypothetical protein